MTMNSHFYFMMVTHLMNMPLGDSVIVCRWFTQTGMITVSLGYIILEYMTILSA